MLRRKQVIGLISALIPLILIIFLFDGTDSLYRVNASKDQAAPTETPEPPNLDSIVNLLSPNEECVLPCLWYFSIGTTDSNEIAAFLAENFVSYNLVGPAVVGNIEEYDFGLDFVEHEPKSFNIRFFFRDDQLQSIVLQLEEINEWLMPSDTILAISYLLDKVADTPDIYIGIQPLWQSYIILFHYQNLGLTLKYEFIFGENEYSYDDPILICPKMEQVSRISLQIKSSNFSVRVDPAAPNQNDLFYWSIGRIAKISSSKFVEQVTSNPESCIEIASYEELVENGYGDPFQNK